MSMSMSMSMSVSYWLRDPFRGGCTYHAPYNRKDFVRGYYPPSEFEGFCHKWKASNLPGQVFRTADEAMDASDEAFYASGFVWEEEEDPEEEDWQTAEDEEEEEISFSQTWDPKEEAARVAGRTRYYYWA